MTEQPKRPRPMFKRAKKSRLGVWAGLAVVVLVGFYVVVLIGSRPKVEGDKLRTDTFFRLVEDGRRAILEVHARAKPLAADVDLAAIARRAVGLSGADLGWTRDQRSPSLRQGTLHLA